MKSIVFWLPIVLFLAVTSSSAAQTDQESLEIISQVYTANREKMESFTCRFRVTDSQAASQEGAIAETGLSAPRSIQDGLWMVLNGDVRYELTCVVGGVANSDIGSLAPEDRGFTGIDCRSQWELYSAKHRVQAAVSPTLNVANLDGTKVSGIRNTPISMGVMGDGEKLSPVAFIRGGQAGNRKCVYRGEARIGDSKVDVIECGLKKTDDPQVTFTWYLDLARGGVPLRVLWTNPDGSVRAETVAKSVRRLPNGAYVCERSVMATHRKDHWAVHVIELTSFDTNPPPREALQLMLPEGCRVIDARDLRAFVRTTKAEPLHVDQFPLWLDRCQRRGAERAREQQQMGLAPHASGNPAAYAWWGSSAIAVGFLLAIALFIRRRLVASQ